MTQCSKCNVELSSENWSIIFQRKETKRNICKGCWSKSSIERGKKYNHTEKGRLKRIQISKTFRSRHPNAGKNYDKNLKEEIIGYYSNGSMICANCKIQDIRVLTIDHINGGGGKHRKEIGVKICRWLKKNNFPEGFQVLCFNCNWIKRLEDL